MNNNKHKKTIFLLICFLAVFSIGIIGEASGNPISKWDVYEITLTSTSPGTDPGVINPYLEVDLSATFNGPGGITKVVKGFWDGERTYKIRFTPTIEGPWTYSITNNQGDSGLTRQTQTLDVVTADPDSKGFVRVDTAHPQKFIYDNGEYYFMVGTTAYEYMTNANDDIDRWKNTIDFYSTKGINKVRFFVFPADYTLYCQDEVRNRARQEGMKYADIRPFVGANGINDQIDYDQLNLDHWRLLDQMVEYMQSKGMVADLIMLNDPCYQKSITTTNPNNPSQQDGRYMEYIVKRYAAYPNVIWCITNEYMLESDPTDFDYGIAKYNTYGWNSFWDYMGNLVSTADPYREDFGKKRLLSNHGYSLKWDNDAAEAYGGLIPYPWFEFNDWATHAVFEWQGWQSHLAPQGCYEWNCFQNTYISPNNFVPDWEGQRSILKSLEQGIPVVNDEFDYVGNKIRGISSSPLFDNDYNRRTMWGIATAGGFLSIGDSYTNPEDAGQGWSKAHMSTGDYTDTGDMQKVFNQVKYFNDFFTQKVKFWEMSSHNDLVSEYSQNKRVYTLANPGNEYVVYSAIGNSFNINLVSGKTYDIFEFNPKNGNEIKLKTVINPTAPELIDPPNANDWVYRITDTSGAQTCTSFNYTTWSECQSDNTETRTVTSSSPTGCTGGNPVLTQSCTYDPGPQTCTSFNYTAWGECQPDNTETRTVTSSFPSGCTGGNPVLTQSCTYDPGPQTCTSFNYTAWGECQPDNTETRTVASSSPSGCIGGNPMLTQSCTYDPGVPLHSLLKATSSPVIDGNLGEYALAHSLSFSPATGGNTVTVRTLWDSEAIYLGINVIDSQLNASVTTRDGSLWNEDSIEWFIDTYYDGGGSNDPDSAYMRTDDYHGIVNVLNTQYDSQGTISGAPSGSWNGSWQSVVKINGTNNNNADTDSDYTMEVKIPWTSIGYSDAPSEDTLVGLSVAVNDKDASGITRLMLPDITNAFENASNWKQASLSGTDVSVDTVAPSPPTALRIE